MSKGAKEPIFSVTISSMKPIFKKIKYNQTLAEQLYTLGNYDDMNNFIMSVGISYLLLREEIKKIAQKVGKVAVFMGKIIF